ncbi:MAG: hypothetical protein AB8H80_04515 [Planctomycetota bacterium]
MADDRDEQKQRERGAGAEMRRVGFGLEALQEQSEAFWQAFPGARADERGQRFVADAGARLHLPLAGSLAVPGEPIGDFHERLGDDEDGHSGQGTVQMVLLLRAGAMALGVWRDDELIQHKAVRKYVVRGNGKAQGTHLKTRGKSRYGSRLRLQNWKSLLVDTCERWRDLAEQHGPIDRVLYSAPVRVWSELFACEPEPPLTRDAESLVRIPLHVHRPDHEELLRVRRLLRRGVLELPV